MRNPLRKNETLKAINRINAKLLYKQGGAEMKKKIIKLLEKGKMKDAWGYWIIMGDWDGLIKELNKLE